MATKARISVRDLMTDRLFTVGPDDDLATVRDLMVEHRIRHIPVVDPEGNLMGLISHRDLLRHALIEQVEMPMELEEAALEQIEAREVMVRDPVAVPPETDIRQAAQILFDHKYGCLPVTEGSRLVGILTEADFVRLMAQGD